MSGPLATRLVGDGIETSAAGGKGAALDRLVAMGARVPDVGVVTTEAYRLFTATPTIARFLDELRQTPVRSEGDDEADRGRVDEAFLSEPLPDQVADAVDRLVADLVADAQGAFRSSATAEDMAAASFAGQYESLLGVEPGDAHDAVRSVWASLWYPSPRSYRHFRGLDEDGLAMAVVVMRMLDPSLAGVLFTVDPAGEPDTMRLEVVEGLGEQLVSGEVTPDAHVIGRDDLVESFTTIAAPLGDLAREALRVEDELGEPQDIEFAVADDELYLLQTRPITVRAGETTSDDGFDFSCGTDTTYTTAGISEMLPGVIPPLLWGLDSWLIENGFRSLFTMLGGDAEKLTNAHALIGRFNGRAALNLDAMRQAAGSIPGGSPEELEQQYFGAVVKNDETNRQTDQALHASGASKARQGARVLRARREAAEEAEIAVQTVKLLLDGEPDVTAYGDDELLGYWNRLVHVAQKVAVAEVAVASMASASYRGVEVFLSRYMDSETAGQRAREITAHSGGQRRARIAFEVEPLVQELRGEAFGDLLDQDWETTRARLEASEQGTEMVSRLEAVWRRAGSTAVFAGPTWDEVPDLAWLVAYQQLDREEPADVAGSRSARREQLERDLVGQSQWRTARWMGMQIFDVRRRFFRRQADEAAEFLDRREATKASFLQLGGLVRRCHLEIGRRLAALDRLERIEDIEFVGVGEIETLFTTSDPTPQTIARRRRIHEQAEQLPTPPRVWNGTPDIAAQEVPGGERFEGWSASPGRYEGPARVVHSPSGNDFRHGEVLVAQNTDASSTPLFLAAGAIVVEEGGPLSHAAIVARELGLPAVVNVPGFAARIEQSDDDTCVVVDGTNGVVSIHGGADDETAEQSDQIASTAPGSNGDGDRAAADSTTADGSASTTSTDAASLVTPGDRS